MPRAKIELLANLPIFRGLSPDRLGSIAGVARKAFFEAGEDLITKDRLGGTGFLIMTGSAKCSLFPAIPAIGEEIGPGCLVGELAMLAGTVHALTVQATVRLRAVAIHRDALKQAMLTDPAIAKQISDNLLVRLRNFSRDLRKMDRLLALAEGASLAGGVHGLPARSQSCALPRFPFPPPSPERGRGE